VRLVAQQAVVNLLLFVVAAMCICTAAADAAAATASPGPHQQRHALMLAVVVVVVVVVVQQAGICRRCGVWSRRTGGCEGCRRWGSGATSRRPTDPAIATPRFCRPPATWAGGVAGGVPPLPLLQ